MGIHASVNVSEYAHQKQEPRVEYQFDYDQYVIMEDYKIVEIFDMDGTGTMWERARTRFLELFNEQKRCVKLIGRVFN